MIHKKMLAYLNTLILSPRKCQFIIHLNSAKWCIMGPKWFVGHLAHFTVTQGSLRIFSPLPTKTSDLLPPKN